MPMPGSLVVDLLDLVLGRACIGCGVPGRTWCTGCLDACPRDLRVTPLPRARAQLVTATEYAGVAREAVVDYKEHGNRALAPMLGRLLADAVGAALAALAADRAVLVPVPGHRRPDRGFDALGGIVRHARAAASADGTRVDVVPALRLARDRGPIKTLGRAGRRSAVGGSMGMGSNAHCRRLHALARAGAAVIVVDDVVTTGATVTEAVGTLAAAGQPVDAVAAVARA